MIPPSLRPGTGRDRSDQRTGPDPAGNGSSRIGETGKCCSGKQNPPQSHPRAENR